ncbi:hypothetical protein BBJ28_00018918 [Nothophytophthora sp. Chile5]|nr:hypothetical protein BBJ28_00018918 [Nothophytophthora sp. Chile5]
MVIEVRGLQQQHSGHMDGRLGRLRLEEERSAGDGAQWSGVSAEEERDQSEGDAEEAAARYSSEEEAVGDDEAAEVATYAIQRAWRGHVSRMQSPGATANGERSCCISCFKLMPPPPEVPPQGQHAMDTESGTTEPELLCVSCISVLAGRSSHSAAAHSTGNSGVLSPLPKLSLLVQAEAKCQDQLQLLRSRQSLLLQQREKLQATKRAKVEALAAERELAKQRRKHFLLVQERRKREEELKFQQFQVDEHTSRSEQEGSVASEDKLKKKKGVPKPHQLRKTAASSSGSTASSVSLPRVVDSTSKPTEGRHTHSSNGSDNTADTHSKSLWERRRQTLACYSQDLSPLIDGLKPKRLPLPRPAASSVANNIVKKRPTPNNNAKLSLVTSDRGPNNHRANARNGTKPSAAKSVKLRPLEDQQLKHQLKKEPSASNSSNQQEEVHERGPHEAVRVCLGAPPLSLQPPRRVVDHSTPLTAEIRPVSWAFELGTEDFQPREEAEDVGFPAPLYSVAEEEDAPQFSMFPLRHQLPTPTFTTTAPAADAATKLPRWEYSAERLTSLLEKYNISVSAAASAAPKV